MSTINGLPAHVLLVHAVVVLVPLTATLLLLTACWPAARRRLSLFAAATGAVTLVSVPLATEAGEWLEHHLPRTPLLHIHTELGDYMLPWAVALFVATAAVAVREFLRTRRPTAGSHVSTAGGPGAAPVHTPTVRPDWRPARCRCSPPTSPSTWPGGPARAPPTRTHWWPPDEGDPPGRPPAGGAPRLPRARHLRRAVARADRPGREGLSAPGRRHGAR